MLRYYPVSNCAQGLCGLAYPLRSDDEAIALRLPALTAQVQVTLSGFVHHEIGLGAPDPELALLGPTSTAANVTLAARTVVIGLGLLPTGWLRCVQASAAELANTITAGDTVWGSAASEMLMQDMQSAPSDEEAAAALFRFVVARQGGRETEKERRIAVVTDWLSNAGSIQISSLSQALDLSLRQTERFTGRLFGASPKALELKYRALRLAAVSALSNKPVYDVERADLVDSFYDQSHLIRNFQRYVGHPPTTFDRQAEFARLMLQGRWNRGARTPLTLWS